MPLLNKFNWIVEKRFTIILVEKRQKISQSFKIKWLQLNNGINQYY